MGPAREALLPGPGQSIWRNSPDGLCHPFGSRHRDRADLDPITHPSLRSGLHWKQFLDALLSSKAHFYSLPPQTATLASCGVGCNTLPLFVLRHLKRTACQLDRGLGSHPVMPAIAGPCRLQFGNQGSQNGDRAPRRLGASPVVKSLQIGKLHFHHPMGK